MDAHRAASTNVRRRRIGVDYLAFLRCLVHPNDSSVDSLSSSRDPLWPTGRTIVAKWLRDRRISYGRVSNDVFILINGACVERERDVEARGW